MRLLARSFALYGRFTPGARARFEAALQAEGAVLAERSRRAQAVLVGARSLSLVASGRLSQRLARAVDDGAWVLGERRLDEILAGYEGAPATAPLAQAARGLEDTEALILAAFDLVTIENGACRFADASVFRAAAELKAAGRSLAAIVRDLTALRDAAPAGRRKLVAAADGEPLLAWEEGLSTLKGQFLLPLAAPGMQDVFAEAAAAEAEGDDPEAIRLYEIAARRDRKDAAALFNLGNLHLRAERWAEAALAYQRALAREPAFPHARYNRAMALEALGRIEGAAEELERALALAPDFADAAFNLAALSLRLQRVARAKALFERYLASAPPADWAARARRALAFCEASLRIAG